MKKIFTKLFLLATILMVSSQVWAQNGITDLYTYSGELYSSNLATHEISLGSGKKPGILSFKAQRTPRAYQLNVYAIINGVKTLIPFTNSDYVALNNYDYFRVDVALDGVSAIQIDHVKLSIYDLCLTDYNSTWSASGVLNDAAKTYTYEFDYQEYDAYGTPGNPYTTEITYSDQSLKDSGIFTASVTDGLDGDSENYANKARVEVNYNHIKAGTHNATLVVKNNEGQPVFYLQLNGTTTKANQTITWNMGNKALNVGDQLTLDATASSGLGVTYTSSNTSAVTVSGNTLTAVGEGNATITALQAGNSNYNAATDVTYTVSVSKATPTVTAWPTIAAVTYGARLEQALVLVGGEASVAGTFAITDSYKAADVPNAGTHTYNVTFTPSETNKYNIVSGGTATLVVNKADQELTWSFADCTLLPGQTLELNATATCGAMSYLVSGAAISVSSTTLTAVAEGTASIKATHTGNENYNAIESPEYTITVSASGYTRTVTNGNYGTICLPYGSSNYSGADFYEIAYAEIKDEDATGLYLDQIEEGAALVAGKPYIFKATADILIVTYKGARVDAPVAGDAGLTGTLVDIPAGGVLVGNYIIAQNMFWDASAENWLNANRAYINKATLLSVPPKSPVPGRRRVSMGETSENGATDVENSQLPMINSQKLIENGQFIIIRDGVKYNAQGQKL